MLHKILKYFVENCNENTIELVNRILQRSRIGPSYAHFMKFNQICVRPLPIKQGGGSLRPGP